MSDLPTLKRVTVTMLVDPLGLENKDVEAFFRIPNGELVESGKYIVAVEKVLRVEVIDDE